MKRNKKSLLFVMDTFPLGGIAKSLLALFSELGNKYEIDFLLRTNYEQLKHNLPDVYN